MSLLITDSKVFKPARQLGEAHSGNAIYLTLKNLKKERTKHLQEIALAKKRQQSPIGYYNNNKTLSKRRDFQGETQEDHSDKKLQEIENKLRSCVNQRGEQRTPQSVLPCNGSAKTIADQRKNQQKILDNVQNLQQEKSQVKVVKEDKENSNHTAVLDQRRLSQNNVDNQRNYQKGGQETQSKSKRVNSAKGFVYAGQESGYQQDKCRCSNQQKSAIEIQRQDDCSSSASRHRIPENSVSELRLKRIREQNAFKSRILLVSSNEQAASQGHESKQSQSYLGNVIEGQSGSLKEGAKKRIRDLVTSEESQPNEDLNVQPDEIKGYINGLIQVLNIIGSSSKQTIKQEETTNKLENNQKISKSLGNHQERINNGSIKKSEYNPIKYGYSQGMSSEILHSVIIKKKESSADHVESRSHKSFSPHENVLLQRKISHKNDNSPKKQNLSVASNMNCNINTKQLSDQASVVTKSPGKQVDFDKLSGSRVSIIELNTKKEMDFENVKNSQQKQQQQITNINQRSWFGSIENRDCPQSSQILHNPTQSVKKEHNKEMQKQSNNQEEQIILKRHSKSISNNQNIDKLNDCDELSDFKNQRREGLIKVHSGRNIIKTINPYRSSVSLESLRRPRISSASNSISKPFYAQKEGTMEGQVKNNTKKSRSKTYFQFSNAKTIHTEKEENKMLNEKPTIREINNKAIKGNQNKSCVFFEDENQNEVSFIKSSVSQVGFSKLRSSFINSELLNDLNIKRGSQNEEAVKVSSKQQKPNIIQSNSACSSNNNKSSKQSEMKNNPVLNDLQKYQINITNVQHLESGNRNAKKPPTHKQLLQNKKEQVQPDQFCMQTQQQQQTIKAAQNLAVIPKPSFNEITKLSRQSSYTRITQGVPSNNEVPYAAMQQSNNQQNQISNPQSSYDNVNNSSCERILDLLLLNTHELKNKFQEAQQPQQYQQTVAQKNHSKSTLESQPHISPSINDFQQFAQKLFSKDCNLF